MKVLYKPVITRMDKDNAILNFDLNPTSDPDLTVLRRRIQLTPEDINSIDAIADNAEKFIACRNILLRGDAGFQADWAAEKAAKNGEVVGLLEGFIGYEFPETTEEELDALAETVGVTDSFDSEVTI